MALEGNAQFVLGTGSAARSLIQMIEMYKLCVCVHLFNFAQIK